MTTGFRNTTLYGTTPELLLEYQESVDRVVASSFCPWYLASPAWRRSDYCAPNLSDLQVHLEKFREYEYYINETQILLAIIHRSGMQSGINDVLAWLHAEFRLRVQEEARLNPTTSSQAVLLSAKITRLIEELKKSALAPNFDYTSPSKHEKIAKGHSWSSRDEDFEQAIDRVQESTQKDKDEDEKNFHQLSAAATEQAARIDALENKVSGLLSTASTLTPEKQEQEPFGSPGEASEAFTSGVATPTLTVRNSSPVPVSRQHTPIITLCVKGHKMNMPVIIGLDTSFESLRWYLGRSRSDSIELWHGNTQIMDEDTPNTLGLEENSLISILVPVHTSDWVDVSKMHIQNASTA